MSGAAHHRGKSKQDYATPRDLLDAVEERFGPIIFDLAADSRNAVVQHYFTKEDDAFQQDWHCLHEEFGPGLLWLNPEYRDIAPWAQKCAIESAERVLVDSASIAFLVPAAVGSCWYAQHVHGKALVLPLRPRVSFDGKNPYPKDIILCMYGETPGFEPWRWKGQDRS